MALTAIQIASQALVRLGALPISDFAEPVLEARTAAALYPTLARARARFGAAGTGSAGGSAAALLGGLAAESEREGRHAGNAASRRLAALGADRAHAGRLDRLGLLRRAGGLLAPRPAGRRG